MKYINKSPEPREFADWKQGQKFIGVNCNYKSLQNPQKQLVHDSLLQEQGYICCYCCQRIQQKTSHIEHFAPQSKTDDNLSVEYNNLLASCGPYDKLEQQEKQRKFPQHCGNYKENQALAVSPLQQDCEEYFGYTAVGEIISAPTEKHPIVQDTIEKLGLNDAELIQLRQGVLEALLEALETMTAHEAQQMIKFYQNLDENGFYQPFCVALIYFLKEYF